MINTTSWRVRSADILLLRDTDERDTSEMDTAFLTLASPDVAEMVRVGHVRPEDMPERWYAVENLRRPDRRGVSGVREFAQAVTRMLSAMVDNAPLAWQCSRQHAQAYGVIFGDRLTVIAGTLVGKPIHDATWGGDEQIVLLRASA